MGAESGAAAIGVGRARPAIGRAPAQAGPRPADQARRQVAVGDDDQRDLRVRGDRRDDQRHDQQAAVGTPRAEVERLEAAIADGADHQERRHQHHRQRQQVVGPAGDGSRIGEDGRGRHAGGRRAGHADEVALVDARDVGLDVEARQADRRRRDEHEAGRPAGLVERLQAPREAQDRRRHAERHDVGERVELDAERARRAGHARDAAVQHVEDDGDADEHRRLLEVVAQRVDHAGVAAEQVAEREQAGQQVGAAAHAARDRRAPSARSGGPSARRRRPGAAGTRRGGSPPPARRRRA